MPYPPIRRIGPSCIVLALLLAGTAGPAVAEQSARMGPERAWQQLERGKLALRSKAVLVVDEAGNTLYARSAETPMPIASLTKLMTAMVILDAGLPLDERIEIDRADRDLVKLTGSRLEVGARLTRRELLVLALMASENRAAAALARTYPGGDEAFVKAMNARAGALGMRHTRFTDAAGLDPGNVASAEDLGRLVLAAMEYPLVREASTRRSLEVRPYKRRGPLRFGNTNRLLRNANWDIQLSKTGYINEAGRCLVMHAELDKEPIVLVLLNSFGKLTPFGDANRVRSWLAQNADRIRPSSARASGDASPPG